MLLLVLLFMYGFFLPPQRTKLHHFDPRMHLRVGTTSSLALTVVLIYLQGLTSSKPWLTAAIVVWQ